MESGNKIHFSVVIPVYNTIKELERCVESIVNSEFQNYEVVLVDDGSKDGSAELCDKLAAQHKVIRVIHKINGGAAEARNVGIKHAQGEYIIFVDSDDLWNENKLQELSDLLLEKNNPDVLLCGVTIFQQDGTFVKELIPSAVSGTKKEKLGKLVKKYEYISAPYTQIVSRDFLEENQLYFTNGMLCEDIEWSARIMQACTTIEVYPASFYKRIYRNEDSATANVGRRNIIDLLQQITEGADYIKRTVTDVEFQSIYLEYWAYQYAMLLGFF